VIDREMLDSGQFRAEAGGFGRIDRIFEGRLEEVLGHIHEEVWRDSA
jgi:type I restriction enzyme R subunit